MQTKLMGEQAKAEKDMSAAGLNQAKAQQAVASTQLDSDRLQLDALKTGLQMGMG
jgi:hypothetical protein